MVPISSSLTPSVLAESPKVPAPSDVAEAAPIEILTAHLAAADAQIVRRAWDFAQNLYLNARLSTGESMSEHALGLLGILDAVRADALARAGGVLFAAAELLARPDEQLAEAFGPDVTSIALGVRQLARVGELTRRDVGARSEDPKDALRRVETLRKMLLAFATDIRVVLVRLASRLQTLRYFAASKQPPPAGLAEESLMLYSPLANRLGVWQIKWELEDLSLRFIEPETYKHIARMLDQKRVEREAFIQTAMNQLDDVLRAAGVAAELSGRPKHIYSIVTKMRNKGLDFENLYDVRALRVIVADERACYAALAAIHAQWTPLTEEFDDYIARPKSNGYRSLHTVVRDANGQPFEVQIRTREMHRFAEFGVAAHWRYKEAGASVSAQNRYDEKIAWLRQLLAWKAEVAHSVEHGSGALTEDATAELAKTDANPLLWDEHIYVLTPQARVVELPAGATPLDFAYHLHTDLGHRCRGARVDGAMVPLTTALKNGQTVEVIQAKPGALGQGPSRDWLNLQLGFLKSARARVKVRQWFNAQELRETAAAGRVLVEKTLQREGKTAVNLEDLAERLGFNRSEDLYVAVAKDELSLRNVETALGATRAAPAAESENEDALIPRKSRTTSVSSGAKSGILVVGVGSLMTQLARCCRPAPPDSIVGFVTRGKGVSIHRANCANFATMRARSPERVIDTAWGAHSEAVYPVDVLVVAADRQGLLRDISEIFSREKINVVGVRTESRKGAARMRFTAEVADALQLERALVQIREVSGIEQARRD